MMAHPRNIMLCVQMPRRFPSHRLGRAVALTSLDEPRSSRLGVSRPFLHAAVTIAVLSAFTATPWRAFGQTDAQTGIAATKQHGRAMTLELNKSRLIDLPGDVSEVVISNPTVVEAVVRTPRR